MKRVYFIDFGDGRVSDLLVRYSVTNDEGIETFDYCSFTCNESGDPHRDAMNLVLFLNSTNQELHKPPYTTE